jgi:hypothetical protein
MLLTIATVVQVRRHTARNPGRRKPLKNRCVN